MKKKKIFSFFLAFVLMFAAVVPAVPTQAKKVKKVKLKSIEVSYKKNNNVRKQKNVWYVVQGTRVRIGVKVNLSKKTKPTVKKTYKSSNKKITQVNKAGVLYARKTGKTAIRITVKGKNRVKGTKKKTIKIITLTRRNFNQKFNKPKPAQNTATEKKPETTEQKPSSSTSTQKPSSTTQSGYKDEYGFVWEYEGSEWLKEVPRSNYKYKIKMLTPGPYYSSLSSVDNNFEIRGTHVVFYVETDNPFTKDDPYICLSEKKGKQDWGDSFTYPTLYDNITTTSKKECIFSQTFKKPGTYTYYLLEAPVTKRDYQFHGSTPVAKITIKVQDIAPLYNQWLKKVVAENTNSSMTKKEKIQALSKYLKDYLLYDWCTPTKRLYTVQTESTPFFFDSPYKCGVDCIVAPRVLKHLGTLVGVDNIYYENHYARAIIDGTKYTFDPTPPCYKSEVNLEDFPKVDLSTLPDISTNNYVKVTNINN